MKYSHLMAKLLVAMLLKVEMVRGLTLSVNSTANKVTEIRQCRKAAWNVITKRKHEVLRVYTNSPTQDDLLLFGEISVALKNDKHLKSPFAARLILSNADSSSPKAEYYEPIAVSVSTSESCSHSIH